jgi:hypothetical protein
MSPRMTLAALTLGWAIACPASVRGAQPSKEEIQKLVGQLGSANGQVAAKAGKRLAEIGMPALGLVSQAAFEDKDKRQRAQAEAVVQQIIRNTQAALEKRLGKRTKNAVIYPVRSDALARVLPAFLVYAVRYPRYPVAVRPPAPLKAQNLFIVDADGQMDDVSDFKGLEDFFRANVGNGLRKADVKDAAVAWLALSQELVQDGFFKFSIPDDAIKVGRARAGLQVFARAVVRPGMGNQGYIQVTITFDTTGQLDSITEEKKIRTGTRPK